MEVQERDREEERNLSFWFVVQTTKSHGIVVQLSTTNERGGVHGKGSWPGQPPRRFVETILNGLMIFLLNL